MIRSALRAEATAARCRPRHLANGPAGGAQTTVNSALQGAECQTCDLSGNSLSDPWQTLRTASTDWPELRQVGTEAMLKTRGVGDRMERKSRIQKLEEEPPPPPPQWLSKTSAVGGVSVHWHGQRPPCTGTSDTAAGSQPPAQGPAAHPAGTTPWLRARGTDCGSGGPQAEQASS